MPVYIRLGGHGTRVSLKLALDLTNPCWGEEYRPRLGEIVVACRRDVFIRPRFEIHGPLAVFIIIIIVIIIIIIIIYYYY